MPKGRPTGNTKLVQVLITPEQYAVLLRLAELRNTTLSEIMRDQVRTIVAGAKMLQVVS